MAKWIIGVIALIAIAAWVYFWRNQEALPTGTLPGASGDEIPEPPALPE